MRRNVKNHRFRLFPGRPLPPPHHHQHAAPQRCAVAPSRRQRPRRPSPPQRPRLGFSRCFLFAPTHAALASGDRDSRGSSAAGAAPRAPTSSSSSAPQTPRARRPLGPPSMCPRTAFDAPASALGSHSAHLHSELPRALHAARTRPPETRTTPAPPWPACSTLPQHSTRTNGRDGRARCCTGPVLTGGRRCTRGRASRGARRRPVPAQGGERGVVRPRSPRAVHPAVPLQRECHHRPGCGVPERRWEAVGGGDRGSSAATAGPAARLRLRGRCASGAAGGSGCGG